MKPTQNEWEKSKLRQHIAYLKDREENNPKAIRGLIEIHERKLSMI